jgi:hypothetical protein
MVTALLRCGTVAAKMSVLLSHPEGIGCPVAEGGAF